MEKNKQKYTSLGVSQNKIATQSKNTIDSFENKNTFVLSNWKRAAFEAVWKLLIALCKREISHIMK